MEEIDKLIKNPFRALTLNENVIPEVIKLIEDSKNELAYLIPILLLRSEPYNDRYLAAYKYIKSNYSEAFPGKIEAIGVFLYSLNPSAFYGKINSTYSFKSSVSSGTPQLISPGFAISQQNFKKTNTKVASFAKGIESPAPLNRIATPAVPSLKDDQSKRSATKRVAFASDVPENIGTITSTPSVTFHNSPIPRFSESPKKSAQFYETPIVDNNIQETSDTITLSPTSVLSSHGDLFDGFDEESLMTLDELNEPTRTFSGLSQIPAELVMNKYGFRDDEEDDFMPKS